MEHVEAAVKSDIQNGGRGKTEPRVLVQHYHPENTAQHPQPCAPTGSSISLEVSQINSTLLTTAELLSEY
jgi:hypothetical protein